MPNPIRVLIVLDDDWVGAASFGPTDAHNQWFGLSEVVRTLQDAAEPLEFAVTKAHRGDDPQFHQTPPPGTPPVPPELQRFVPDFYQFHFDAHDLSVYDQIWLFGTAIEGAPSTLTQAEVDAVFRFMQGGGGIFATGDHWDMGAAMCGRIPRVRSMRRWFFVTDPMQRTSTVDFDHDTLPMLDNDRGFCAPSPFGSYRHDTLQPGAGNSFAFDVQSDAKPQPLTLKYAVSGGRYLAFRQPHPLLCSPEGDINVFPDHMHEGEVQEPWDYTRHFALDGANVAEYPKTHFGAEADGTTPKVRPDVIAWANVLPGHTTPTAAGHTGDNMWPTKADEFGAVCVYDGVAEGVGRVVVDSTWHHFFDINVIGDPMSSGAKTHGFDEFHKFPYPHTEADLTLRKMRAYYKNIAVWLARPASQLALLTRAASMVALGAPFNEIAVAEAAAYSDGFIAQLGAQAAQRLHSLLTSCTTISVVNVIVMYPLPTFPKIPPCDPFWWEFVETAAYRDVVTPNAIVETMLGGIIAELLPLRRELRAKRIEAKTLEHAVLTGALRGQQAFVRNLERSAEQLVRAAKALQMTDETLASKTALAPVALGELFGRS